MQEKVPSEFHSITLSDLAAVAKVGIENNGQKITPNQSRQVGEIMTSS